jgi:hypothetical protein
VAGGVIVRCALSASIDGDPAPLYELVNAIAGPGCVLWPDLDPRQSIEETIGLLLRGGSYGGARNYEEARKLATVIAERAGERIADGQRRAELDPFGCPLDLQAVIPIPRKILLRGYEGGGRAWLFNRWGVSVPLAQVSLSIRSAIVLPKRGRGRPRAGTEAKSWTRTTAHWEFEAESFPFPVFRRLLGRWPGIEFRVEFVDEFGKFDKTWPTVEIAEVKAAA